MAWYYLIPLALLGTAVVCNVSSRSNDDDLQIEFREISDYSRLTQLKLVSMNIAQLVPSQSASADWSQQDQEIAVVTELLRSAPDVICLQECPSSDWAAQAFSSKYSFMGSTPSHAGFVSLMARKNLQAQAITNLGKLPMVAAHIGQNIAIASVHLEPFQMGSFERLDQIETLQQEIGSANTLIILGDTNMRDEEDEAMESLGLTDAWKEVGSDETTRYSWDTTLRVEDGTQNLYYGASTRTYQRRYDRIYYSSSSRSVVFNTTNFHLIANRPASRSKQHFLSDHFGIATTITLVGDRS